MLQKFEDYKIHVIDEAGWIFVDIILLLAVDSW
jgi:hypothetical protein